MFTLMEAKQRTEPKKAEKTPNEMARDAAVFLLRSALTRFWSGDRTADIEGAIAVLAVVS